MKLLNGIFPLLVLSGCASVESVPGADAVVLLEKHQLADCQRLGSANAQVLDKIAFVERDQEKMAAELLKLGQNEAVKLGGNALTVDSDIQHGSRRFVVYRCQW
ncbi:hypothetical protein GCM10009092_13470 [Bowmanella denitrificans]|uniref:Lipoprotein n=1 Tax=Bowmanella denitrificans TaxID=366582 RepID=A0ABN0WYG8_9ALTE